MDVQKVTVRVPATSANCGPGFDCLGLACSLYNVFTFERIPQGIEVSGVGEGAEILPLGRHNLAVSSFYALWEKYQGKETGIRVTSVIHVPVSRGLGSSSTAVVAGLMAANAMLGSPLTKKELVTEATLIEGHPDNVAPAILGGITINIMADDKVKSLRFLPACPLGMIVCRKRFLIRMRCILQAAQLCSSAHSLQDTLKTFRKRWKISFIRRIGFP